MFVRVRIIYRPAYKKIADSRLKLSFHDTDTDILARIFRGDAGVSGESTRILARMSVSAQSASWNASLNVDS